MTPLTFSLQNAIEIIPDERRRVISAKARDDAEKGKDPDKYESAVGYWDSVIKEHEFIVYMDAYSKRKARILRKKRG